MADKRDLGEEQRRREALSREMLAILDGIELLVKQLVVAGSQANLYAATHPAVREYTEKAHATVKQILGRKEEFSITIHENLLIYENIPLYRLSVNSRKFIDLLEKKKVGGMTFTRGVQLDELVHLVDTLMSLPEEIESGEVVRKELTRRGVEHIEIIEPVKEAQDSSVARPPRVIYKDAVRTMRRITRALTKGTAPDMKELGNLACAITRVALEDKQKLLALASVKDYDEYEFTHPVNVCIYATSLASVFIKEAKKLDEVGRAAMLHDVGEMLVPREIIRKPARLDEREEELLRRHPVLGARMLEEMEGAGHLAVVVAFEHHMNYDRSGYPQVEAITRPLAMSLLVQVADAYDTMTSHRPRSRPEQPGVALAEMSSGAGTIYEPRLLKEFVSMMSVLPPGTVVELDSGEIGLVERSNEKEMMRPVVRIVRGRGGEEIKEAVRIDCSTIDRDTGKYAGTIVRSLDAVEIGLDKLLYMQD